MSSHATCSKIRKRNSQEIADNAESDSRLRKGMQRLREVEDLDTNHRSDNGNYEKNLNG